MDLSSFKETIELLIIVVPIGVGFIIYLRNFFTTLFKNCLNSIVDTKIQVVENSLNSVLAEFKPNGGGSLRDAINRIESKVSEIDLTQKTYIDFDSDVPMFQTDVEGRCKWVNKAYLKLVGRTMEEVIDHGWLNFIIQDERDEVFALWNRTLSEFGIFEYEYNIWNEEIEQKITVFCRAKGNKNSGYVGFLIKKDQDER